MTEKIDITVRGEVFISKKDFEHIEEIIENAGELNSKVPYKKLVTTAFTKK